ncbi:MAG TPA: tetratricopeptide repeat protein [Candidatus Binatia bacterium]
MFANTYGGHYQPLSWITLGLDYLLWGMNPLGYHLTNLMFHALNAVLLYFIALRLLSLAASLPVEDFSLRIGAVLAALLFAVHPLRVESVAWITERRDVLSGLFFLLTVIGYINAATAPTEEGYKKWMALTLAVYVLSLLSKATGMSLPAVLLVLDVYPLRRLGGGPGRWFGTAVEKVWAEKLPFVLLAVVAGITAVIAQGAVMKSFSEYGLSARLAQALFGLAFYLWKTIVPVGLSPIYEFPRGFPASYGPYLLLCGAAVLLICLSTVALRKVWPAGLAVLISYVAMVAPVSGIAQSGPQFVADRYSYLACLGWAILAGGGLAYLWRRWLGSNRAALSLVGIALIAALAGLGYLTRRQVPVWHDTERLWRHVLALYPDSPIAHNEMGNLLQKQGKFVEAVEHHQRVVQVDPKYWAFHYNLGNALAAVGKMEAATAEYREAVRLSPTSSRAQYNLGLALFTQGKIEEAIAQFHKTLELEPMYASAHYSLARALAQKGQFSDAIKEYQETIKNDGKLVAKVSPNYAAAYSDWGNAYFKRGQYKEAAEQYRQAIKIDPENAVPYYYLGNTLLKLGQPDQAIEQYRLAIKNDAKFAEAYSSLGNALQARGNSREAIAQYRRAVESDPEYAEGHYNLANALLSQKDYENAVKHYRRAIEINPKYAEARTNLAVVLAQIGEEEEALAQYRKALEIAPRHEATHYNLGSLLSRRGDERGAIAEFRAVTEINPRDAGAHYQLGKVLAEAGRVEQAVEEFKEALRIDPGFTRARQSLEQLVPPPQAHSE